MSSSRVPTRFKSSKYTAIIENPVSDYLMKMHGHIGSFTYPSFSKYSLRRLYHMRLNCFNPYKDRCNLIEYMLRGFVQFASSNLNPLGIFMYISLSMDSYKYVIITSMRHIFSLSETAKLIKKWNVTTSMTGEYVFSYSMSSLYKKPCATNCTLYLMISLFSLRFRTNTHLYLIGFTSSGVWTIGPKTSHFVNEFNFTCIASFHFGQSFLCRHSSTFRGLGSSSFLMISKATWKAKILLIIILFWSHFFLCVHNLLKSHNFQVLVSF